MNSYWCCRRPPRPPPVCARINSSSGCSSSKQRAAMTGPCTSRRNSASPTGNRAMTAPRCCSAHASSWNRPSRSRGQECAQPRCAPSSSSGFADDPSPPAQARRRTRLNSRPCPRHRRAHLTGRSAAEMVARRHRAFEGEHPEYVLVYRLGKLPKLIELHGAEILALLHAVAHRLAHHLVGIAERHHLAHHQNGEIGG